MCTHCIFVRVVYLHGGSDLFCVSVGRHEEPKQSPPMTSTSYRHHPSHKAEDSGYTKLHSKL